MKSKCIAVIDKKSIDEGMNKTIDMVKKGWYGQEVVLNNNSQGSISEYLLSIYVSEYDSINKGNVPLG